MTQNLDQDILSEEQIEEHKLYLKSRLRGLSFRHPSLTIPQYAEKYIRVQTGPKTGPFSLKSFPPLEEPLFHAGPQSKKQHVFVMASIQTMKTMLLDIIAQYYTDHYPQDQLFVSATERMGKKWRLRRYEPMMNASGVRNRRFVGSFTENKSSRRTGETMWSIEYDGKIMDIGTANSASSLSADTKRILLGDEVARWPDDVGGEGDPWQVAIGRITAWLHMGKAIGVSSPLLEDLCKMESLYKTGDQRKYLATCPYCGKGQFLVRGSTESKSGLKWETKAGRLDSSTIRYVCEFCDESIFEHQKSGMLDKDQLRPIRHPEISAEIPQWIDTATPEADFIASYQMSGLYSPFFSWKTYAFEYQKALKNPEKMQTFVNQRDGLPFKLKGMRPDIKNVIHLQGDYKQREIPHETLFLTAAVDIQHGQENWEVDPEKERPRLELEIKGHGEGFRLFGIQYEVFEGYLEDVYAGAWKKFRDFIQTGGFNIESRGMIYDVKLCLIDVRSAKYTEQAYNFCREMGMVRFNPSMGFNVLKRTKQIDAGDDGTDESSRRDYDRFRRKQENDVILYELSTYTYKLTLYTRLNISINHVMEKAGEQTPSGYCGFPADYPENYFEMLLSEEHLPGEQKFKQLRKRNEALDLSVYNMAAGEIWLYQQVALIRAKMAGMKAPAHLLTGITAAFVIKMLKSQKAKGRNLTTAELTHQLKTGKS